MILSSVSLDWEIDYGPVMIMWVHSTHLQMWLMNIFWSIYNGPPNPTYQPKSLLICCCSCLIRPSGLWRTGQSHLGPKRKCDKPKKPNPTQRSKKALFIGKFKKKNLMTLLKSPIQQEKYSLDKWPKPITLKPRHESIIWFE